MININECNPVLPTEIGNSINFVNQDGGAPSIEKICDVLRERNLRSVRHLAFSSSRICHLDWVEEFFPHLTSFRIDDDCKIPCLIGLSRLPLRIATIKSKHDRDLEVLEHLNLDHLSVRVLSRQDLKGLNKCRVNSIEILGWPLATLDGLEMSNPLSEVRFQPCKIEEIDLAAFGRRGLYHLWIQNCRKLRKISGAGSLSRFQIQNCRQFDLSSLSLAKGLKMVEIFRPKLESIEFVAECQELKMLLVRNPSLASVDLTPISRSSSLSWVEGRMTKQQVHQAMEKYPSVYFFHQGNVMRGGEVVSTELSVSQIQKQILSGKEVILG